MNSAFSLLDVSLRDLLDVAGETVLIGGRAVRAVVSSVELQDQFMDGGHNVSKGATVAVRKLDLNGSRPSVGDLVRIEDTDYQILRIDSEGPGFTYTCSTPSV
jgi:hypothetical protein